MALLQQTVNSAVDQVVNNFPGQRIAMPNGRYVGECTAPITWYLQYLGLQWNLPMYNDRADGWGIIPPNELKPYFIFEKFQPGREYPRGSILMWNSPHIALVLSDAGGDNNVVCFEQNADPDGSPCGTHNRTLNTSSRTCTYAMVPIIDAPLPPLYTVENITPKLVQALHPSNHFDLTQRSAGDVASHVIDQKPAGYIMTAVQILHHVDTADYYVEQDNGLNYANGYDTRDWVDYTPPVYVPPAAPVPVIKAEKYTLLKTLKTYASAYDARSASNSTGTLDAGEYMVWSKDDDIYNLTTDNQKDQSKWVNTTFNVKPNVPVVVVPPVVTTPVVSPIPITPPVINSDPTNKVIASMTWFWENHQPAEFTVLKDITVYDQVHTGKPKPIKAGKQILVYGYFVKNGQKYLRPILPSDLKNQYYFYGIPTDDPELGTPYLNNIWSYKQKVEYHAEYLYDKVIKTIEGVFRLKKKKGK